MQRDYRRLAEKYLVALVFPAGLVTILAFTLGDTRNNNSFYPSSSFPPPYTGHRVTVVAQPDDNFYRLTQDCPPTFEMNGRNYKPKHPGQYWADDAAGASYKSPGEVLRIGENVNLPAICRE